MRAEILSAARLENEAYSAAIIFAELLGYDNQWLNYEVTSISPRELENQREDVRSMLLDQFEDLEGDVLAHVMDDALTFLLFPFEDLP